MAKPTKLARAAACRRRGQHRDPYDEEAQAEQKAAPHPTLSPQAAGRGSEKLAVLMDFAAPGAVLGEVETIEEIAPRMLALLRSLPSGTRVYLRLKQTVH